MRLTSFHRMPRTDEGDVSPEKARIPYGWACFSLLAIADVGSAVLMLLSLSVGWLR